MEISLKDIQDHVDPSVAVTLTDSLSQVEQKSYFSSFKGGFSFWFRFLKVVEEELEYGNLKYLLLNNQIYTFDWDSDCFVPFGENGDQLIEELENHFIENEEIVKHFMRQVDSLEDDLYDRKHSSVFMDNWFDLKKELSRIERFYDRHLVALASLDKWNRKEEYFVSLDIAELIKNTEYSISNVKGGIIRLDGLHHYYSSIKNDKLNKNIYMLTLVSGVFLPLNLIVGFFGMNTKGLFFEQYDEATKYVLLILLSILVLSATGLTLIKLIDRFILRILLGRTTIYKGISTRMERLESRLGIDG